MTPGGVADGPSQDSVLCGHDLRHHRPLRPVRARQRPLVPGLDDGPGLDVQPARDGDDRIADAERPQGLLALHQPQQQLLGRRFEVGHRARQPARGAVHGDERQALQQRVLLRLRQQRGRSNRRRARHHGCDQLQLDHGVGHRGRQRSVDLGRSRVRALLADAGRIEESERSDPDEHVRHRRAQEQRDDGIRPARRQRAVREPEHVLQRRPPRRGMEPDEEARCHRPRQRRRLLQTERRRQPERRHFLRGKHRHRLSRRTRPKTPFRRTSSPPATASSPRAVAGRKT